MRNGAWADRLGRWLPAEARRDLWAPSLGDLRIRHLETKAGAAWSALCVIALYLECLRVGIVARVASRFEDRPRLSRPPRREFAAMLLQDLRRALRLFRLESGFTAAAVLTLALGIGANTALFAVVEAVLLRPLPFSNAGDLVIIKHRDKNTGLAKEFLAIGDFVDLRTQETSLETLVAYGGVTATMLGGPEPVRLEGLSAAPDLFDTLRVQPAMGRFFTADDSRQGAQPVVVIGYELWQTQFGSDPNILSRSVQFASARRLIVGVAAKGFHFPPGAATDVIFPATVPPAAPAQRKSGWVFGVGRLKPGQTIETARADFERLSQQFERQFPEQNRGSLYYVEPIRDALLGDTKRPLLLLLGAVGFVLLIACANVGNLLLARSLARQQEMSVRMALGAGWGRLAAQVLTEALVLSMTGAAIGVAVAWKGAPALASLIPQSPELTGVTQSSHIPGLEAVGLNGWVLAFSVSAAIVSAVIFGAISCLTFMHGEQRQALNATRRTTMGAAARRAASALVTAEIALAAVLLIGAGLTLRSFANLVSVDPGFRTANVLLVNVSLPNGRYPTPESRRAFYDRAFSDLIALPEIDDAGAAAVTPLTGNNWTVGFERVEHPLAKGERPPEVGWQSASGGYFRTLDIPLRSGRLFDNRDAAPAPGVVIISEEIARQYFPNEDPVGRRVRGGDGEVEIVGVVGNIHRASLADRPRADMYFPFEHDPDRATTLFVRTTGDPAQALPAVRTVLRRIEPGLVVYGTRTLDEVASASAAVTQLAMRLLAGFAVVALVLAAIGIYGVMAYSVKQRTRELGTRVALGASRGDIIRLMMRQGAVMTLVGLVAGVAGGLAAARSLSVVLYGVPPSDPIALSAAAALLSATALAACYLPARRAARVDPAQTLAAE
ncbi:MAG: ABC transporter permease [Vicinamibacterales bacterium]